MTYSDFIKERIALYVKLQDLQSVVYSITEITDTISVAVYYSDDKDKMVTDIISDGTPYMGSISDLPRQVILQYADIVQRVDDWIKGKTDTLSVNND